MIERSEIEELLAAVVDGDLQEEQASRLLKLIEEDPGLVDRFGNVVAMDRLLAMALSENSGKHFVDDTMHRISFQQEAETREAFVSGVVGELQGKNRNHMAWMGGVLAAAAAVVLSLFLILKERPGEEAPLTVARIVGSETGDQRVSDLNDLVVGGRVVIDDGLLEIGFLTGVRVVLNGPVDFEITGRNSGYLHRGRLVAEVAHERGHGFTIDGANGRLIDLGTKFGVAVDDKGEMEVHVIEGIVDAEAKNGVTTRLRENEAMRLAGGLGGSVGEADEGAFYTKMPPESSSSPKFVRWSFDEEEGTECLDTGRELGQGNASATFMADAEGGRFPRRVKGRFLKGLFLDGSGYLASKFGGVEHAGARTIAFWVKVPEDFGEGEGFGIVNWGSYVKEGAAWQVAINSVEEEGPEGRLRIGTNGGEVIGVTDLRGGEWHHCAVVLYGDQDGEPNTATHILLYVDGNIEGTSRKSVRVIDTSLPTQEPQSEPKVWIGRNLGHRDGKRPGRHGKYFRGGLDELIISDQALSLRQINELMRSNRMPSD